MVPNTEVRKSSQPLIYQSRESRPHLQHVRVTWNSVFSKWIKYCQQGHWGVYFAMRQQRHLGGQGQHWMKSGGYTAPGCNLSCRPGVASLGSNLSPTSGSSAFLVRMGLATLSYTHYIFINGLFTSFGLDYF